MNTLHTLSKARSQVRHTLLLLCVVLAGCGSNDALQPLSADDTIVAFGDSLTFGLGTTTDKAYPAVLESLSGITVINAGVSGETTAEGKLRLPGVLDEHDPAFVILFEGGNDILRNVPAQQTKANLNQMIRVIQAHGAQVVLVGIPEKSLFSSSAPWYAELAEEHGLALEKSIVSKLLKKPKLKSDGVHFNADGYRVLAESVHALLSENGAY